LVKKSLVEHAQTKRHDHYVKGQVLLYHYTRPKASRLLDANSDTTRGEGAREGNKNRTE
jgi:hypothetical protein